MKKTRYTETQIIKILKEVEGGRLIKEVLPGIWDIRRNVLQLEVEVRWYGGLGCEKTEGA